MYKFRTMYSGTEEEQDTGWTVAGGLPLYPDWAHSAPPFS